MEKQNNNQTSNGLSYDTKTLIVVLLLVFAYPVGLILMYMWMKWPAWVKNLIAIPVVLLILLTFFIAMSFLLGLISGTNPKESINKANCVKSCNISQDKQSCINTCIKNLNLVSPILNK